MSSGLASLWILGTFSDALKLSRNQTWPSFPSLCSKTTICRSQFAEAASANEFKFVLHDALDSSGVDTTHARVARNGFCSQVKRLSDVERETSISINREVDLGKTALYIAAEDDSLISHSSVPLPVDSFIERLDGLSMDYCSHFSSSFRSSPETILDCLERYLYINKAFRRNKSRNPLEQRALYLHSVLTHRLGSASMLSLIYSEILKMLRLWGLLNFDVEIFFPRDSNSSPRGYLKQKSEESDQPHIMTTESLLVKEETVELEQYAGEYTQNDGHDSFTYEERLDPCELVLYMKKIEAGNPLSTSALCILRDLKDAFWPFQLDHNRSLFLRAAEAANCSHRSSNVEESGFELASAKAAQHRLERGVWTSVRFGDMRRALSACERLILLETDSKELRDYSVLLYHSGFYEESLQYLKLYQDTEKSSMEKTSSNPFDDLEKTAVEKLIVRLDLILMEEGWSTPKYARNFMYNSEPW